MIVAKNLSKAFGNVQAVNSMSFHITKGETVGLIGANGAGKTTLIRMMCGLLKPSSGFVRVFRTNPVEHTRNVGRRLGIVLGSGQLSYVAYSTPGRNYVNLQSDLTLKNNFENIKSIYRISKEEYNQRLSELCSILDIRDYFDYRVSQLSLGQCMRAEIAAVLLYEPELLVLDEPYIGIDIMAKRAISQMLKTLSVKKETTIILTTHNVEEIESVCSRVILLDGGNMVYNGTLDRLKTAHAGINALSVKIAGAIPDLQDLPVIRYTIENDSIKIWYDSNALHSKDITNFILSQTSMTDLLISKPSVEEVLKNIYKGDKNERYNN